MKLSEILWRWTLLIFLSFCVPLSILHQTKRNQVWHYWQFTFTSIIRCQYCVTFTPHYAAPPATWRPCSGTGATSTLQTGPCWTPSPSTRGCSGVRWWWWPDLTCLYRSGLGLSLRADILSLDPGALSLMSGLSGLDGVSLHSLEALQRLKGPHASHGPPPLIRPDPTHPPSNVRTMATKERDINF